jgi:membrane-associated phospholipid phosphatase
VTAPSAPNRCPGAYLAAGILVFVAMTLVLVGISEDVIRHEPLIAADARFSAWLFAHRSPFLTSGMRVMTSFGATLMVTSISIALALYLLWRRHLYWLAALAWVVPGGALLNVVLKVTVHRARPNLDDPLLTLTGFSFPSGHTMMTSVLYGFVAAYVCAHTPHRARRVMAVCSAGILIALVGLSRIYLGVHYLSDVLGAMAEGLAWLSLWLTLVYAIWQRNSRTRERGIG